jgi:hypothetical protein
MKIDKPQNANYAATVVEIKNIIPLENCDNVVATTFFGFQAIIGKDNAVGTIGIVFPAETQLSDEYCYNNDLYRHGDKNHDESKKGYLEDNRRIKAVKFRGHNSSCLFMPLDSLKYTRIDTSLLNVGDEFDMLSGKEICKKYQVERKISNKGAKALEKKFSRVDAKHMPEHYDSSNFFKYSDMIAPTADIIVTQKLHGTSIRIGHTLAKRKFNLVERVLERFGVPIQTHTHDYVFGSRKVIKDINNPYQNHFYDTDIWTEQGKKLVGMLPENYIVYGELIGWTGDHKEIQKDYTYSIPKGSTELYIYRIAIINSEGYQTDLSWQQVKEFCDKTGLKYVPELWKGKMIDFDVKEFIDVRFFDGLHGGYRNALYIGDNKDLVDEGVCIRVDGIVPTILKAKSPIFFEHETKMLDTGEEDLESTQSPA